MAREGRYADRGGPASGMHLFDFNETLSGKRLPDDRRIALDYQMDKLYKGRDSPKSRAKREEGETTRTNSRTPDKKMNFVHGGSEYVLKAHSGRDMDFRPPNVVARLMGLDTLPNESVPAKQAKKKGGDQVTPKQAVEKQSRRQNEFKQAPPVATVVLPVQESYYVEDKAKFNRPRGSDNKKRGAARELPDVFEIEEMKRQLALKQMLVREKLNEATRLLTGEKLSDKRWLAANQQLNQSKEFLDAIDFFQTNRDAFLKYVEDQDSVLGKHIEKTPGVAHRNVAIDRPVPEGLRNPIVRKVIEGRREDALKNFSRHSNLVGAGEDIIKNLVPDNQAPTRIVVLKPSPNRNASPTSASFSPGPYANSVRDETIPSRRVTEACDDMRRIADTSRNEGAANPREIAKEIARQVRESVVRDLARNALQEQGAGKRLNVTLDNSDGPRLGGGSEFLRGDGVTTPTGRTSRRPKPQVEAVEDTGFKASLSSVQKKPSRPRQQASGSSPPMPRPVSKGIVVLVPDQSVSSRISKVSEAQNREIVSSSGISKQVVRKDRIRKNQQVLPETSHKLGDSFRKARSQPSEARKNNVDLTNREFTNTVQDDAGAKVGDYSLDEAVPGSDLLGYGGSFLLKTSGFESQGENEASLECSDSRDTLESEYTADIGVSEAVSQPETDVSRSPSAFLSSNNSVPTVSASPCEEETDYSKQSVPETSHLSSEVSSWRHKEELLQVSQEEEELVKASPTTTDVVEAVDVDETSISSDNSGQPSPISVLESSFEESPGHVDFDTISSELEELRIHLRRLKWDDNDQEGLEISDVVVDKVVVEEKQHPELETSVSSNDTGHLQWLELEKCKEEDGQKVYVKNILLASGLIKNSGSGSFLVEQHSQAHALDPMLFQQLEGFYRTQAEDVSTAETTKISSMKRRHLFDMVDEILTHKFVCDPWLSTVRTVPGGGLLVAEVWSKLSDYFVYPQGEDLQHTVENLIEKYLMKGDRWMELQNFVEAIGVEVEAELLNELYEECLDL
ncbi:uncharacterized protein LOC9636621 isoform X1 [Selaginella moellendorffii]|uniref:uncharacterized protein LOC9636621 isoform X1 n=1 Tax=Selaginella moellendorffii TaxID=88036 RepID=UPI000D1CC8BF|nr:uncharacterized protein LOC9636621 isoform X1 [Selaginella moellendorffii]|eukprot:XP_024517907.1 uncharacterized protein LOC9636621 isoform X1 [Selaginella moellendorffii]